ncbi:iron chelate uptake ABC transporter family permease subunit [Nocardia puris]|uniref:Iron complex transport system permease protein n=1 Tax=Nocardia puris TaxID=208602 RepID=A0A366DHQ1_9NOCA|nr:iron chelate uptake ABC transporter family permease subunit [Nocardia puris]MBF6213423.1 iron chelate uptake ABC transporter family permease subunit [Nocardia puris]MBF6369408.1 iron chelate uptake ABC transporter family permease subunit [Nocardia puris]MBF6462303.1 iron chelate uptake ABC transporter family permease subunit [Nocardia puris]RBO89612.1 iron complex transport system permease protein [Nocardia puris]
MTVTATGITPTDLAVTAGPYTVRFDRRATAVTAVLAVLVVLLVLVSLMVGEYAIGPAALWDTLTGDPPRRLDRFFVFDRRLPRALVAVGVGGSLAAAGAIFQRLHNNPLASPDLIGFTSGASFGAVFVLLSLGGSLTMGAIGAAVGALTTLAIIGVLTVLGRLRGARLVLVGIALGALATSATSYLLSQTYLPSAAVAHTWLIGSLSGRGWGHVATVAAGIALVTPLLIVFERAFRALDLGDTVAATLGVRGGRARMGLMLAATVLVGLAVAAAGPIAFIALAAPHIARGLTRTPGAGIVAAACTGALLLGVSDLVAEHAFPAPVPVGVVTVSIGGVFLLWLLVREGLRHRV